MTAIPETMSCIEIIEPGGPEVLRKTDRPVPEPAEGEVLIAVQAAGVNRPDCIQRQGHYAPPPGVTDIPGLEVAGNIVAVGKNAGQWKTGDTVCALVAGGGYAEFVTAPAVQCLAIPGSLGMTEAAALPETFFTVWANVFDRAGLKPGETLLVHGGSSGIGTAAIQIASKLGSTVMTTAGSDDKCRVCRELGAELAVNYKEEDFVDAAKNFTGGVGVNVILDMVGGDYLARNIKALAPDGRHVSIAFLGGSKAEINFMPVMLKRLTLTGSTLRPLLIKRKGEIAKALEETVWPLIGSAEITPVIHATFPLQDAADAHELMESSQHIGKIVLLP
ncbi:MAG TPA: NAD(P)H-quinone oxidoreductase [Rhodospirillales bacterium]|nr:NAD(P)H-quinone oxidoreductase [Rhodospirillales bacterium]